MVATNHLDLGPEPGTPLAYDPMTDFASIITGRGPHVSIDTVARMAGLTRENGWTFDTALPQPWCDEVKHFTRLDPYGLGIVWAYGPRGSGYGLGAPFALTPEGSVLLTFFEYTQSHPDRGA